MWCWCFAATRSHTAQAVAPKNMDRISTWVVSKGEVYQNQAPAGAWGAAGSNADGLADVDADEGPLPERKGFMPAAGKVAAAGGSSGKWVAAEPRKGAGGALAAPVPMEAREDDAMSDGGQSAMSGVSGALVWGSSCATKLPTARPLDSDTLTVCACVRSWFFLIQLPAPVPSTSAGSASATWSS